MTDGLLSLRMFPPFLRVSGQAAALGLALALGACASGDDGEDEYVERPVGELYNEALDKLEAGQERAAARAFEEVERQHPYSEWATRAQLMGAYALYEAGDYGQAVSAAQRYIDLHPGHKDVPYAFYLVGVAYYDQMSDVGRDQKMTEQALQAFEELTRRFPDSDYARDARLKADLARDHLAGKEMEVGRYYQKRGGYVAAVNRFRNVVERYQSTSQAPEALHRLTECYLALGVREEAQKTAAVLGYNYPGSRWYADSYRLMTGEEPPPEQQVAAESGEEAPAAQEGEERWLFDTPPLDFLR